MTGANTQPVSDMAGATSFPLPISEGKHPLHVCSSELTEISMSRNPAMKSGNKINNSKCAPQKKNVVRKYLFAAIFAIKQCMQISNIPEELLYPLCGCRALQFKQ